MTGERGWKEAIQKKKRLDAFYAPAEERQTCLFPTAPAHRPSFFSYFSPQEFVDLSNQMYIAMAGLVEREIYPRIVHTVEQRFEYECRGTVWKAKGSSPKENQDDDQVVSSDIEH